MTVSTRTGTVANVLRQCGLWLALAWLYLYSFPYFPEIRSANELPRIYLTQAMVDEGTFRIDTGVRRSGSTADVSEAFGHFYSNKAPGSSFLAVPAYLALKGVKSVLGSEPTLAEMFWTFRVFTGVIPTLCFLVLFARFLRRFSTSDDARRLALCGYALGSMAMTYSILFIAHQLSAVCIATAYILGVWVVDDDRHERWLMAAGFFAGAAPLVDYQAAFAGVPVAVYVAARLMTRSQWPRRLRGFAYALLGATPPIALLLAYHHAAFGSPFKTGYDFSKTFAHFHQQGFLGMTELRWEAFFGSILAPDHGLLWLCPMLLLCLPGLVLMARRRLFGHLCVTASVIVLYLLFISSINFWRGGWSLGPRYITAMLPFAMIPVTVALDRAVLASATRAAAVALVVVSMGIYALSCAAFPHVPESFQNPLYELTLRLFGDNLVPYNLGWLAGLRGLLSLVPYFLVLAAVIGVLAIPRRALWRSGVAGLVGAAVILGLYSLLPGGGARANRAYQWITTVMPR